MKYRMSAEGKAELANYEGLILTPYYCAANVKTVGLGSTISDIPDLPSWPWDKEISVQRAVDLFEQGLAKYERAVNNALKVDIKQHQFDVLVSICYNIGIGGMRRSTFMRRVNNKESDRRITAALKMWNKAAGRVNRGLVNRRKAESKLWKTGIYKSGGYVSKTPTNSRHRPVYRKGKRFYILPYFQDQVVDDTPTETVSAAQESKTFADYLLKFLYELF
jgi:GH24 family phage-related lysozyme (muramidase)